MPEAVTKLSCGTCGKSYAWKPQYAGKTLKCACGAAIKAPGSAPMMSASAGRRPAASPVAPPPDLSAADEFERALSGAYDTADEPAPPPKASGTRYQPAAPAPAPRQGKGTSFTQARPVDYEATESSKSSGILSSPVFVLVVAVVGVALLMVVIVSVLRTIKPAQKHIYQTSRSVTTFEGTKEIKHQLAPDETLDANGNIVKKQEQKEVDFRTVQLPAAGQEETPEQKRIRRYKDEAARNDEQIKKLLETPNKAFDAREWLNPANENHQGAGYDTPAVLSKKVDALYEAGAKKVWVSDITGLGTRLEYCASFIVEMPEDFETRKKVLAARATIRPGMDTTDWSNNYLKFPCASERGPQF
jgi:hypothetical protein